MLDIGCNGGFYSIEMKRRGAARVLGIDSDTRYLAQARFAAEVEGAGIEFREMSVYELPSLGERFDVVLFMRVLYHLRHPLLALDILHEYVWRDMLVFQSMLRGSAAPSRVAPDYPFSETDHFDDPAYPRMYFVEHKYAADPTNWWIPNRACAAAVFGVHAGARHLPVVPFRRPAAGPSGTMDAATLVCGTCARDSAGPTAIARARRSGSTARCAALEPFDVTVTFCFTPEAHGVRPHHTSPPREPEAFAEFCAAQVRRYA